MILIFSEDIGLIKNKINEITYGSEINNFFYDDNLNEIEQFIIQPKLFFVNNLNNIHISNAIFLVKKNISNDEKEFINLLLNFEKKNNIKIIFSVSSSKINSEIKIFFDSIFELKKLNKLSQKSFITKVLKVNNINLKNELIDILFEMLPLDASLIMSELEKLKLYNENEINEKLIKNLIIPDAKENIFKLIDNFLEKNEKKAIEEFTLLFQKGIDVNFILSTTISQIYNFKLYLMHYKTYKDINLLLKDFNIMKFQIEKWISLFDRFNINYINLTLKNLLELNKDFLLGKKNIFYSLKLFFLKGVEYENN